MYCNQLLEEYNNDIEGQRAKELDILFEHEKEYKANRIAEDMAHFVMLWLKYFRKENTSYDALVNSSMDEINFTNEEWNEIIENSKIILNKKYNINIVSCDPLILSSGVSFCDINENKKDLALDF